MDDGFGEIHHLTSDLNNMALHQANNGKDLIPIGYGTGLSIIHTNSLSLCSQTRNLILDIFLYIPNIKKNIITVYRIYNANKFLVEFYYAHL